MLELPASYAKYGIPGFEHHRVRGTVKLLDYCRDRLRFRRRARGYAAAVTPVTSASVVHGSELCRRMGNG